MSQEIEPAARISGKTRIVNNHSLFPWCMNAIEHVKCKHFDQIASTWALYYGFSILLLEPSSYEPRQAKPSSQPGIQPFDNESHVNETILGDKNGQTIISLALSHSTLKSSRLLVSETVSAVQEDKRNKKKKTMSAALPG